MPVILKFPRTQQPRSVSAPPALAGLRNLWNFGDGSGGRCQITGTRFTLNSSYCFFQPDGTLYVNAVGANNACYAALNWVPQDCTIVLGYRRVSGVVPWSLMNTAWNGWYDNSSTWTQKQTASIDFAGEVSPVAGGPSNGPVKVVAISAATNDFRASLDGGPIAIDSSTTRPTMSGGTLYLRIGADYADNNRADVYFQFIAILDRTSSDAGLRVLSGNPWSRLASPVQRRIWMPSVASGGSTYAAPHIYTSRQRVVRASRW